MQYRGCIGSAFALYIRLLCQTLGGTRQPLSCLLGFAALLAAPAAFAASPTTTTLAISAGGSAVTSVAPGAVVTLTATVTAGSTPVTPGLVNFCDATATYCIAPHISGSAQLTSAGTAVIRIRPGGGNHSYKAVFVGTHNYGGSASGASALSVPRYPVSMLLAFNPSAPGNKVSTPNVAAMVDLTGLSNGPDRPGTGPTGTVTLTDTSSGNAVIGTPTLTLTAGSTFTTMPIFPGTHIMSSGYGIATADFNGDGIPDLAFGAVEGATGAAVAISLGNGDGSTTDGIAAVLTTAGSGYVSGITAGDFNNDGIPDLAVAVTDVSADSGTVYILTGKGDGTFNPVPFTVSVPGLNGTIKTGDFNGDGNADLIVFSGSTGGVTLLGNGDGTFQIKTANTGAINAPGIAVADFNLDGIQDLIVSEGQVTVFLGNGDGTFSVVPQTPAVNGYARGIAVGDMNGDGVPDLVAGSLNGFYSVLLGKGDGTFSASSQNLSTAPNADINSPVIADFNGDGIPDVAGSDSYHIYVWFAAADGTFTQAATQPVGISSTRLTGEAVAADLNGDGVPDVAVNYASFGYGVGIIALLEFQSQSQAVQSFTIASGIHNITAQYPGDTNWASISQTNHIQYQIPTTLTLALASTGLPTVGQPITFTATVSPAAQGGVSTDGQFVTFTANDVTLGTGTLSGGIATLTTSFVPAGDYQMVASFAGNDRFESASQNLDVTVLKASPTLTLTTGSSSIPLGQSISLTATATGGYTPTMQGDGVTFSANGVPVGTVNLSSTGVATFIWQPPAAEPQNFLAVFAGDTNNNPVTSNQAFVSVLKTGQVASTVSLQVNGSSNPGSVTPGTPATLTATVASGGSPVTAGTVRFCNLQFPAQVCSDLVNSPTAQLNSSGQASLTTRLGPGPHNLVAYFTGTTTVGTAASATLSVSGGQYAATLLQGCHPTPSPNCFAQILVSAPLNPLAPSGGVRFVDQSWSNNLVGDGGLGSGPFDLKFSQQSPSTTGAKPFSMAAADFNHDGLQDLAVANSGDNTVGILLGKGDGTFQGQVTYATGAGPFAVAEGDFNNDGNPDLAVTNFSDNTVSILLGEADGTFQPQHTFATGGGPVAVVVGDFNSDGQLDLAIVNNLDNTVSILLGKGDGTFQAQVTYATGTTPDAIVVDDFNGDQAADLAIANNGDSTISVLLSNGDGTFQAQIAYPTGGAKPIALVAARLNSDVNFKIDLAVANTGDGTVNILHGVGDGTFSGAINIYTLPGVQAIAAGNFDALPFTDLVVASSTEFDVIAYYGDGLFTLYGLTQASATGLAAIAVVDWDGNGVSDFALLGNGSDTVVAVQNASYARWVSNTVTLNLSPPSGTHTVAAQYEGDSNYPALISNAYTFTLPATSTKLAVSSNRNPSNYGDTVTMTATLTPYSSGTASTDGESIKFSSGTTVLGTGTLASGVASLTTSSIDTGVNTITATYIGDQYFAGSTGSLTQTVRPPTLTVTAENATRVYGTANPAFTVKVTGAVNGDAFTTSAATTATQTSSTGSYSIIPSIAGSGLDNYSVVKVNGTLTITPAEPTITLKSSEGQAFTATSVTFTATTSSSTGVPSGSVSFYDGSTLLGKDTLSAGSAAYTTSSLAFGVHTITAVYSGDTNFVTVTSPAVTQTIESFTITVPSGGASATISSGGTASYTFSVAPPSGSKFLSEIKFSVTGAPSGSTSTFNPNSIASDAGATNVTLEVKVPTSATAQPVASPFGLRALPVALGLVFLPWLLPLRRRARNWLLTVSLVVFGLTTLGALNGCGGDSSSGSGGGGGQPQTYTLTVSATSGSLGQTTKLTLTVK